MESKICTQCNFEKHIINFYKNFSECKECNIKRGVKRYYGNKDKMSMQHKISFLKIIEVNFYRNKMIIAKKDAQTIKNYIDPMLNYKIN